jgi:two-component system sensor histidine kinase YesM
LDNANMFFASSPSVTLQLDAAFHEESLSLDTLRNIENISLYLLK